MSKEELQEHYKSDFHRYNLKRKVAGLPPVTREWFDARKTQLASAQAGVTALPPGHVRVWFDPLTRKTFRSEATYQAHVRSKKYQDLVRASGQGAPAPIISVRKVADEPAQPGSSVSAHGAHGGKVHGCSAPCACLSGLQSARWCMHTGAQAPCGTHPHPPSHLPADAASTAGANRAAPTPAQQQTVGFKVVPPSGGLPLKVCVCVCVRLCVDVSVRARASGGGGGGGTRSCGWAFTSPALTVSVCPTHTRE